MLFRSEKKDLIKHNSAVCSDKSAVRYTGRFDFSDAAAPRFGWPGSSISVRFKGTGISAAIRPVYPMETDTWLNIIINNEAPIPINICRDGVYNLVSGLPDAEHEITLYKRTGASSGELQFLGFIPFNEGCLLLPPARLPRRIEFIGDSITCGYGNEAPDAEAGYKPEQENNYMA